MEPKAYVDMSLSELVNAHNAMATSAIGKDCGLKPIQHFRDKATAVRRCTGAEVRIRAVSAKQVEEPKAPRPAKKPRPAQEGIRPGTNRDKLVKAMLKSPTKTLAQMAEAVYGDATKVGAVSMVLKGVINSKLFSVVKSKEGKTTTYELKKGA